MRKSREASPVIRRPAQDEPEPSRNQFRNTFTHTGKIDLYQLNKNARVNNLPVYYDNLLSYRPSGLTKDKHTKKIV